MGDPREQGVGFRSISDGMIDTTSARGELVVHIFSVLAPFERRLIQERAKAGLAAARARDWADKRWVSELKGQKH
ncbi:MAG: recombinase family protein [Planctomycetota bacterium]|nr:recombinase family protein [Planctomycetota bacterium]